MIIVGRHHDNNSAIQEILDNYILIDLNFYRLQRASRIRNITFATHYRLYNNTLQKENIFEIKGLNVCTVGKYIQKKSKIR